MRCGYKVENVLATVERQRMSLDVCLGPQVTLRRTRQSDQGPAAYSAVGLRPNDADLVDIQLISFVFREIRIRWSTYRLQVFALEHVILSQKFCNQNVIRNF